MDELHQRYVGIRDYLATYLGDDPAFAQILARSHQEGLPEIQISPEQGRLLGFLVRVTGASRVLEIGTLGGYSTAWLARGLPQGGRLISLEADGRHVSVAKEMLERVGLGERVELIAGPALETLAKLDVNPPFDLVFIDADKGNNRRYFDWATEHVRHGGLIAVDNVLASGRVADESSSYGRTVHEFNKHVFGLCAECSVVIPFYRTDRQELDGMLLFRVP